MTYREKTSDSELGMFADISRRDFLNGVGVAIGTSLLPTESMSAPGAQDMPGYYPPALQGMRGSHPGSFESAHLARDGATWDAEDSGERFDLVVVGAGISGLSAAWYYRQAAGRNARILVLDNHDDFGGHAKRNEFEIDGGRIIGYGGTMLIEAPATYPPVAGKLLRDLGIEALRYDDYLDAGLYAGLGNGLFFDRETFGADHMVVGDLSDPEVLRGSPLNEKAAADLVRLFKDEQHYLGEIPPDERRAFLENIDYLGYLRDYARVDKSVLKVMLPRPRGVWAVNSDAYPAVEAWHEGYPGFGDLDLGHRKEAYPDDVPYIFHFPDGNATIARLLVRDMVPGVAPGNDMEDIVTSRFDYARLDHPDSPVRIRLSSTVVRARHIDDDLSNPVEVTYLRDGKATSVEAGKVVMAGYNALIPRVCPEMPAAQRKYLSTSVRAPLVYSNVLIRNWRCFEKIGISRIDCPGFYHHSLMLDFPVSIGGYRFSESPDQPIMLHLTRVPGEPGNPSAVDQFTAGKRDLLATSFETFERSIRDELGRMLGPGGFDPARDIAGITVNRWPHGYAYSHDPETGRVAFQPDAWPADKRVWEFASKRFGNIAIAGSDAASNAMTESAIVEAHRAVGELI